MFRIFAIATAFLAGGWLALHSSPVAGFIDRAVPKLIQLSQKFLGGLF